MFELLRDLPKIIIRAEKKILYETVDFVPQVFNYLPIVIKPTVYKN